MGLAKELGLIIAGRASISLKGYDFFSIIGGIICRNCKKSVCNCFSENKYEAIIKNKDEF